MAESTEQAQVRKPRKIRYGVVTSAGKMAKTITVKVEYSVQHPKYGKIIRRSGKVHAHDEKSEARLGDTVEVMECRPMSKTKSWQLVKVLEAAPQD